VTPIALHSPQEVAGLRKLQEPGAAVAPAPASTSKSAAEKLKALDPKLIKAAQEFEAVFIRQLMKPLEKAGETGKGGSVNSGSSVYGSMMVGAVADSAAAGGGIGLSEMVLKALTDAGKAVPKEALPKPQPGAAPSPINLNKIKPL
jgi:Rod binding domain-containing protein